MFQYVLFDLTKFTRNKLSQQYTLYIHIETLLCIGTLFGVIPFTPMCMTLADPNRNNYHLFNYNPLIYYGLYVTMVSVFWTIWISCAAPLFFAFYVYFMIQTKLLRCKAEAQICELKRLNKVKQTNSLYTVKKLSGYKLTLSTHVLVITRQVFVIDFQCKQCICL